GWGFWSGLFRHQSEQPSTCPDQIEQPSTCTYRFEQPSTYGEHPFQPGFGDAMVSGREDVGRRSQRGVSHRLWSIQAR
ncbi:unnamed protein product, partial [Ectocarpus fasciculatus]